MPKRKVPRSGSLGFWPRKRTKNIRPSISAYPQVDKMQCLAFAGYKAGMTHAVIVDNKRDSPTKGQEITIPITVIECPPLKVLAIRTYKQTQNGLAVADEQWDVKSLEDKDLKRILVTGKKNPPKQKQIGKKLDGLKEVRLLVRMQPRLSGISKKTPEIFEIGVGGNNIEEKVNYAKQLLGKEVKINDVFAEGEFIDVISVTKGKGTQGPVKRFGVKIQTRKAAGKRRHVGALGSETPRRVLWTVPHAGQMGFHRRTELNKRIVKIGADGKEITPKAGFISYGVVKNNYVLVEGSIPGARKRIILMRSAIRPPEPKILTAEVRHIGE